MGLFWVLQIETHIIIMWLLVILFSSQILLISDVLYSFLEYQYDLKNGLPRALDENGHPVTVKLSWNSQFILHQNSPFICVIYHHIAHYPGCAEYCLHVLIAMGLTLTYIWRYQVKIYLHLCRIIFKCNVHFSITLGFSKILDLYTLIEQSINQYMALSLYYSCVIVIYSNSG